MRRFKGLYTALAAGLIAVCATPAMAQADDAAEQDAAGISAPSWIMVDNPSGKVIAQHNAEERLKIGGFPKLMTALLVARLAAEDPKLLDQTIEIQAYMTKIQVTKSGALGGERMTVRDALYATLVGAASDTALALSRTFNNRFAESNFRQLEKIPAHSRSFIAEMNRAARKLGMKDSVFRSAYIDAGENGRASTAHDLARLGIAVMADPILREIVGAKSYSATIIGTDGTTRSKSWNNGNRLLGPDIGGVATTGTPSSGQSIILATSKGGSNRIIVVLGSETSAQRFADAKAIAALAN